MLKAFQKYLKKEQLIQPGEKILLAVSGGMDSVAMAHLFVQSGWSVSMAHCNFGLRGADSDRDEQFVRQLAEQLQMPLQLKTFATRDYAKTHKVSIQVAARELRYNWFNELLEDGGYDGVATAHHLDDQIETFFINALRGSGLAGLRGMLARKAGIIRPLLFATRAQIAHFIETQQLAYREDRSNASLKYRRNQLRHQVLPLIEQINPEYRKVMGRNMERIRMAETVYQQAMDAHKQRAFCELNGAVGFRLNVLKELHPLKIYLQEWLAPYGFNYAQIDAVADCLDESSGKQFFSATYKMVKDRNLLLLSPMQPIGKSACRLYHIAAGEKRISVPIDLEICEFAIQPSSMLPKSADMACLDADLLSFPLVLRKWKNGDRFQPLGMKGMKKLSDFFIDRKLSLLQKDQIWVLCSKDDIVWVLGQRIDHRYRIQANTKKALQICWHPTVK